MTQPHITGRIHMSAAWWAFYNFVFAWAQRAWADIDGEVRAIYSITRY